MFYIIDNGAGYPDYQETLFIEAPEYFEKWFYHTMKPALANGRNLFPLECSYHPTIVAKTTTLTMINGATHSPDDLVTSLFPARHPDKPRFPPQQISSTEQA